MMPNFTLNVYIQLNIDWVMQQLRENNLVTEKVDFRFLYVYEYASL